MDEEFLEWWHDHGQLDEEAQSIEFLAWQAGRAPCAEIERRLEEASAQIGPLKKRIAELALEVSQQQAARHQYFDAWQRAEAQAAAFKCALEASDVVRGFMVMPQSYWEDHEDDTYEARYNQACAEEKQARAALTNDVGAKLLAVARAADKLDQAIAEFGTDNPAFIAERVNALSDAVAAWKGE